MKEMPVVTKKTTGNGGDCVDQRGHTVPSHIPLVLCCHSQDDRVMCCMNWNNFQGKGDIIPYYA